VQVLGCGADGGLGRPDETVGQLRFTGILATRRVSEGCNSLPRLRVGLPVRQARVGPCAKGFCLVDKDQKVFSAYVSKLDYSKLSVEVARFC